MNQLLKLIDGLPLKGKKTTIGAAGLLAAVLAYAAGAIDQETFTTIATVIAGAFGVTLSAKAARDRIEK